MSQSAARQATWYINKDTGSDYAAGTIGAPLKTWGELRRRLGPAYGLFKQATTINITKGLPVGDTMLVDIGVDEPTGLIANGLTITGPYDVVGGSPTGTVGTARPRNHSTRVSNGITPTGGLFDWTPYIASDVIVTGASGVVVGKKSWVANGAGGVATLSPFLDQTSALESTITNGDTYTFNKLERVDSAAFKPPRGACIVKGFVFTTAPAITHRLSGQSLRLTECSLETAFALVGTSPTLANCRYLTEGKFYSLTDCAAVIFGGLAVNIANVGAGVNVININGGGASSVGGGMLFWNSSLSIDSNGFLTMNDLQMQGGSASYAGFRCHNYGHVKILSISGVITATAHAVLLDNNSRILTSLSPTLNLVGNNPGVNDIRSVNNVALGGWAQLVAGMWQADGCDIAMGTQ